MATLLNSEQYDLEDLLQMQAGYVLNFSTTELTRFVDRSTGVDLSSEKYREGTGSKANRIRSLWKQEPGPTVSKLLFDLFDYIKAGRAGYTLNGEIEISLLHRCEAVAARLQKQSPLENVDEFEELTGDRMVSLVTAAIQESVRKNQPEAALDRLHTFMTRFLRGLCDKHSIAYTQDTPLHSLMGAYIKLLRSSGKLETQMTERILSSSISLLDSFNRVRNEHSLAHANEPLNYQESFLIVNSLLGIIKFMQVQETTFSTQQTRVVDTADDIPF